MSDIKLIEQGLVHKKVGGGNTTYDVYEFMDTKISRDPKEVIWAERYRPRILDDLVVPEELKTFLEGCIKSGEIPNILLYSAKGGTGKDSSLSVLLNNVPCDVLMINVSLHRGIDNVKSTVVDFASRHSITGKRKVIYLNEIGGATKIVMDSLKALIEEYSSMVSFIFTTNSMSNISQPLESRFSFFDLDKVSSDDRNMIKRKMYIRSMGILAIEGVKYEAKDLQRIFQQNVMKHRDLVSSLQKYSTSGKIHNIEVKLEDFNKILNLINEDDFDELIAMSNRIDIDLFLSELNLSLLNILEDHSKLPDLIMNMDELQVKIANRVPFLGVAFLVFCMNCMETEMKFKLEDS